MDNRTEEPLCSCVNVGDVTLTIKDEEHRVSGSVRFVGTQPILRARTFEGPQEVRTPKDADAHGSIDPKGDESINIVAQAKLAVGEPISIQGRFEDERTGKTANITLNGVAFGSFKVGLPTEFSAGVEHCP